MSATNVSIRLGVEGKAEIKRAFEEVGQSGQAAFGSVEKAMDRSGAATDREVARLKRLAEAARERLTLFLTSGALTLRDASYDKYGGRIVASATVADPVSGAEDIGQLMLVSGHARPYDGRTRASWCPAASGRMVQSPESFPSLSAQR